MAKTIVGLFDNPAEAQEVVTELTQMGIDRKEINIVHEKAEDWKGAPGTGIGGLAGALIGWRIPEEDAEVYEEGVRRGETLVEMQTEDDELAERVADVMTRHGAVDIERRAAEWRTAGWQSGRAAASGQPAVTQVGSNRAPASNVPPQRRGEETRTIPEVQEELAVGKRQVQRGGVRVYAQTREVPVEEKVRLREERVEVERRGADRPVTEQDREALREGTVEVRETGEEAVVSKKARVTGEVVVRKDAQEREETVRDKVKKTEVRVEKIEEGSGPSGSTATPPDPRSRGEEPR